MSPFDVTLNQVTLTWIKVQVANMVTREFAESVDARIFRDEVWGRMTHQLSASVLTERLPSAQVSEEKVFTFSVPSSPWQQFKSSHEDAWWLRWLVRRWPAAVITHRFTGKLTVNLERYWTYPQARVERQMGDAIKAATYQAFADWDPIDPALLGPPSAVERVTAHSPPEPE